MDALLLCLQALTGIRGCFGCIYSNRDIQLCMAAVFVGIKENLPPGTGSPPWSASGPYLTTPNFCLPGCYWQNSLAEQGDRTPLVSCANQIDNRSLSTQSGEGELQPLTSS
jgi:hypothetical protein